jgi:hypothetical protein
MFELIIENFYSSLSDSIKERKKSLNLRRDDILTDPKRVTQITKNLLDEHHPYLIGKTEYAYLYYLFIKEDKDSFLRENILGKNFDDHIKKNGDNYDKMLWGHINWNKMFEDSINELSKEDSSDGLGKLFDYTLIDYVPYAVIKYDELHPKYGKVYIFPEERGRERKNAINRVHLNRGSDFFKQCFMEKFEGETLDKFDKKFNEFVWYYLENCKPNQYSFGLQAYNLHKNISGFATHWQSLAEVQYYDKPEKKSELEKLLEEYLKNGREQMKKFKKYQQDFDLFNIDISTN